jgi:signal peptidase II
MPAQKLVRLVLVLGLIVFNIGCDQVSKKIVRNNVAPHQTISVIKDHFIVTRVENPGAFLSMGDGLSKTSKNILLSALPLLVIGLGLYYALTKKNLSKTTLIALCFIIGGGIGNIFDRLMYGSVTDFLHLKWGVLKTGIFNLADVSIVAGVLVILFSTLFKKKESISKEAIN